LNNVHICSLFLGLSSFLFFFNTDDDGVFGDCVIANDVVVLVVIVVLVVVVVSVLSLFTAKL
jgi:hypothetical protein